MRDKQVDAVHAGLEEGQAILPADPLSSGSCRLKGGCSQDWLPHKAAEPHKNRRRQDRQRYQFAAACKEIQAS
jgi:hypothetical protein